jgi:choline dehydrogenase-like flavoprotein
MSEPEDTQRESMEFDVLIVGGGPSGLAATIRLKQLSPDTSVCLIEKGSEIGAHIQEAGVAPADAARHAQPRQLCSQPREWLELPLRKAAPGDEAIGRIIAELVPDGACLQMGVGALPNLVCGALKRRNDLGVHTEALVPGLVDLIEAGVVTNRYKALNTGKTIFTVAMAKRPCTTS